MQRKMAVMMNIMRRLVRLNDITTTVSPTHCFQVLKCRAEDVETKSRTEQGRERAESGGDEKDMSSHFTAHS